MGYVYVATNTQLGWDCVLGVYTDEEYAKQQHDGEYDTITPMQLDDTIAKGEDDIKYAVKPYSEVEDMFTIVDSCGICSPDYYEKNTMESISEYSELFEKFCKLNNVECGNIYISQFEREDGTLGGWLSHCDGIDIEWNEDPDNYTSDKDSDFSYDFSKWAKAEHGFEVH